MSKLKTQTAAQSSIDRAKHRTRRRRELRAARLSGWAPSRRVSHLRATNHTTKAGAPVVETAVEAVDWSTFAAEHTAIMQGETASIELRDAVLAIVEIADDINAFCDLTNCDDTGGAYRRVMATLALCRRACDELEQNAKEWIVRDIHYYQARLTKLEEAGLMTLTDEVTPSWEMQV